MTSNVVHFEPMMTLDEVAGLLKRPPRWVRDQARCGKIEARRYGKDWRFKREWVEAFIEGDEGRPCQNDDTCSNIAAGISGAVPRTGVGIAAATTALPARQTALRSAQQTFCKRKRRS